MRYTIGLDIGSTNVKGVLLSEENEIIAKHSVRFVYDRPRPDYVEINAARFAENCISVIAALAAALPEGGQVVGISQASASGNLLLLDGDMAPITPIYNWQDHRVTDELDLVLGKDFDYRAYYEKIGWPLEPSFPLAQLCYIKHHDPALLSRAGYVCMSTEYLNYLLCGQMGIGPSAGTPFFLIDQNTNAYDGDILTRLGIRADMLPPIRPTGSVLGTLTPAAALACGLPEGTPVLCGTFDHPAGALSADITREGDMLLSCGTSWVAFMPIHDRRTIIRNDFLCDPYLHEVGGPYGAMCSVECIGNTVGELVETYFGPGEDKYDQLAAHAARATSGAGGLVLRPDTPAEVIASFPKESIARAIMEMPARLLMESLSDFLSHGIRMGRIIMAGGPTRIPLWVAITEQIIGASITVMSAEYSGAVGAAIIARKANVL